MTDDRSRTTDLPVVEPPFEHAGSVGEAPTDTDSPDVGGVLLAAGTSSRYGDRNKLLATVDGEPVVARAAAALVEAGLDPVIAVTGHDRERVAAALPDGAATVHNPAYEDGQASSVRTGVAALRARTAVDAAVVALGDMPFVDPETVRTLAARNQVRLLDHALHVDATLQHREPDRGHPRRLALRLPTHRCVTTRRSIV
jgi:molybdenum cofactor cytidylyltransferase